MTKQQTEKFRYHSRYSDSWVSAAQFVTELICEKKAQIDKKDLPAKFWNLPHWKSFFRQQILVANGLLKIYNEVPVIRAVKASYGLYSLRAPQLDNLLKAEQHKWELEQKNLQAITVINEKASTISKPRPPRIKDNILSRLEELDGEEEERG